MQRFRVQSLQARLLLPLLALLTLIWLGTALLTWLHVREELDDLLDGHLAQAAALLVVLPQANAGDDDHDADDIANARAQSLHKYASLVAFQVFNEGQLVLHSANAGLLPLSGKPKGFSTVRLSDGQRWRVFAAQEAGRGVQVFVGEKIQSRQEILWAILRSVLLPLLLALPLLGLGGWWAVRLGLAPLRLLSLVIERRQPQALKQVEFAHLPTEMKPMVLALNALFERIETMVATERRFTADAAHELRTPIAGIRAQAQVALGAGDDAAQRLGALQATLAGCDRATHLVAQLLTLARLEAAADPSADPNAAALVFDLSQLTRRVATELAPAALARLQTLSLEAPHVCPVAGSDLLVGVLVRNLLDNALRYSPQGANIEVCVAPLEGYTVLSVEDAGPGMREADMARLGERFFRVLGHGQTGSGLGWSIVKRVATVFDAHIEVGRSTRLGGLAVRVTWAVPP